MSEDKLPALGKIHPAFFDRVIYPKLGAPSGDVVIGPRHGVDYGVLRVGPKYLASRRTPFSSSPRSASPGPPGSASTSSSATSPSRGSRRAT